MHNSAYQKKENVAGIPDLSQKQKMTNHLSIGEISETDPNGSSRVLVRPHVRDTVPLPLGRNQKTSFDRRLDRRISHKD